MAQEHDVNKLPLWAQAIIHNQDAEINDLKQQVAALDYKEDSPLWWGQYTVPGQEPVQHGIPTKYPIHFRLKDGTELEVRWFPDRLHIHYNHGDAVWRQLVAAPNVSNVLHVFAVEDKEDGNS
jgi:hypothetical protein